MQVYINEDNTELTLIPEKASEFYPLERYLTKGMNARKMKEWFELKKDGLGKTCDLAYIISDSGIKLQFIKYE